MAPNYVGHFTQNIYLIDRCFYFTLKGVIEIAKSRIAGITIQLDSDTKPLDKALQGVNKRSRDLQSELNDVQRLLKFNPGNTELLAQQQELLGRQVENTADKLGQLRRAQAQVEQQFQNGDIGEAQYRAFRRELTETESRMQHFESRLQTTQQESRQLGRSLEEAGNKMKGFGNGMKNVGGTMSASVTAPILGGLALVTKGTEEFRQDLARLENNAEMAGVSSDGLGKAFQRLSGISEETDSNVEALSNLMATPLDEQGMLEALDALSGGMLKFPDTMKIEGLADGLQETLATGKAIGPFAELLERMGVDIDTFNDGLAKANENGTTQDYVLQALADTGLAKVNDKYRENNEELVKSREASVNFQQAMAQLGETLTPIVTAITEKVTELVNWFNQLSPTGQKVVLVVLGIAAALGPLLIIIGSVISIIGGLTAAAGALGIGLLPLVGIVAGVIAGIAALIAIGIALYKNWDEVKTYAIKIWGEIKVLLMATWEVIKAGAKNIWSSIKDFFSSIWNGIKSIFNSVIDSIVNFVKSSWNNLKTTTTDRFNAIKSTISNIWNGIKSFFNAVVNSIVSFVKGKWNNLKSNTSSIFNSVKSIITSIWNSIKSFFTSTLSNIISTVRSRFSSMVSTVRNKMNDVKSKVQDGINRVKSFLSGIDLSQMGKDMIQGLINGIGSMAKNLVRKAKGVVNGAIEGAKNLLGIASPSRVFMEIGEYTGEGMAIGMDKAGAMVQRSSRKMADAAIPNLKTPSFGEPSLTGDLSKMIQNSPIVKVYIDGQELKEMTFDYVEERQYLNTQSNLLARGIR
jgi:phage-related minor tail protein